MWFHDRTQVGPGAEGNRVAKQQLVERGAAHHALVMDGDAAVGWCEYGSPSELPQIYHRKEYESRGFEPTAWRLPCFFVDRNHRRRGVATLALHGALDLIAAAGDSVGVGGVVTGGDVPPDTRVALDQASGAVAQLATLRLSAAVS